MVDYIMLMVIFAAYGRFLMLQCHNKQGFLQEIFEMWMLLGQQWVKPGQFYTACGGSFQFFSALDSYLVIYFCIWRVLVGSQHLHTK